MKKIGILTTFGNIDPQYSVANLVVDQLRMLVKYGYTPTLFVLEGFKNGLPELIPSEVIVRSTVPRVKLTDYQLGVPKGPDFDNQVKLLTEALSEELKDFDIIITHDIVFQTWFLVQNQAIRNIAEKYPNIKWIHWCHSAPQARPTKLEYPHTLRFSGMPNSTYIAMNYTDIELYAQQYDVPVGRVQVVYNCRDLIRFFGMHPLTEKLVEKYKLIDCDVMGVYPTRMSSGKNPDVAIELFAHINKKLYDVGKNAKLVFCNSYSNAQNEKDYMQHLRDMAITWGLPKENLIFTSEEGKEWELGVPPQVVRDLLQISNVFFLPSKSEGCSLVLLEAALTKNLIILNGTLPSFKEFGGTDAFYIDADSVRAGQSTEVHYHPDRTAHLREWADKVIRELETNRSLNMFTRIKKKFNPEWVYKNQLQPLLEG